MTGTKFQIGYLMYATPGSAVLNLPVHKHLTLSTQVPCYKIVTGMYSLLLIVTVAIVKQRGSLKSQGFIIN